ncbi:DUF1802 family protein [Sphaerospermopsis aphanizomenoides BCCUSP55]|uniref:DUF1802 family protein n=1 Tax=Sphaerospermopsis aphanizomenoides TaxID=459663 RepID=UPI001904F760|nr:DUF1802 family protein [Sphaerospermopsis aphanizomenoides]MBK1987624.1 DUF1802 family protein [Sphaerospermopsis aphanizomenoides BCCUSP55]
MYEHIIIHRAMVLPGSDVEALIQGRMIVAIPSIFLHIGETFSLYPLGISTNNTLIKAWARCEFCERIYKREELDILSQLTIWKQELFEEILQNRPHFFLAYLRVYHLDKPYEIPAIHNIQEKVGKFAPLPNNISVSETKPVLSDYVFNQRKQQLENRQPPLHPELEELHNLLSQIAKNNPAAQQLENDINVFLGWSSEPTANTLNSDLAWIQTIASLGDRSIEFEEKKSNYQAGTDFENISRKSLEFLGFKVENAYKGGAGGLDLYCSQPYPLVCECKAGRSIPDRAVEELDRIGKRHLQENYLQAVRLIIGPGEPTKQLKQSLEKSAKISKTSIIKAMTLQKLVELKAKYPGAINLIELKEYLEPGQIDYKINEYIEKIEKEIKLRSHIIQLVKKHLEKTGTKDAKVGELRIAYLYEHPLQNLEEKELYDILIELSSPLTGYLGRIKADYWKKDSFYYLQDLPIN